MDPPAGTSTDEGTPSLPQPQGCSVPLTPHCNCQAALPAAEQDQSHALLSLGDWLVSAPPPIHGDATCASQICSLEAPTS